MFRALLTMTIVCLAIVLPFGILTVRGAQTQIASLDAQDESLASNIADTRAWLDAYPRSQKTYEQQRARKLGIADAVAPFTVIQGRFTAFVDDVAREEHIRIGDPSTCDLAAAPTARTGLVGIRCTLTITGDFISQLDTIRRLSAEAPVLADVTGADLQRNSNLDFSPDPTLANTLTVYLERAGAPSTPGSGAAGTPTPTASPTTTPAVPGTASPAPPTPPAPKRTATPADHALQIKG